MKKAMIPLTLFVIAALSGCVDGNDPDGTTGPGGNDPDGTAKFELGDGSPSYASVLPADAQGLEFVSSLRQGNGDLLPGGGGVIGWGDYIFGSGLGGGFWIADISDPAAPRLVFHDADEITPYSRDADLIFHADGSVTLALAAQNSAMHFWDVTDPENPEWLSFANVNLNHNLATVPGTEFVFNSNHRAHLDNEARNELVDVRDPHNPVVVGTFGDYGCHHHYFWNDPATGELALGACAGIEATELWDMSNFDPAADNFGIEVLAVIEGGSADSPVVGNVAFSRDPAFEWHHSVFITPDGNTMIVGSETNGGSSPGGCFVYDETTGTSTFLGALWFYDISDRADPMLLDWVSPEAPDYTTEPALLEGYDPQGYLQGDHSGCNSHFGTFLDGQDKMVVGWMVAGTVLLDYSDPADVRILEAHQNRKPDYSENQNTWDAFEHGGYVFTGDINRGMDVLRLV